MSEPVYLDHNATTPVAPEVLEALLPWLAGQFGNPSSSHGRGQQAAAAVAKAREQVAALCHAEPDEILFTGCATEANNLAVLGVAAALEGTAPARRQVVVTAIEHPAVLEPALELRRQGRPLDIVAVDAAGRVDAGALARVLGPTTALVSVMHANNEVGTVQPVAEIARLAHACGALVHTDAAQSAGKVPLDVQALDVDLLTLAGHKFGAPKGVGALFVRRGTPLSPVLRGAGQEHGLRPGTENVAFVVALGAAAALAQRELASAGPRLVALRDALHSRLRAAIPGLALNGHEVERLPSTLNVSFPGVSGRELLREAAQDVQASLGSACHAESDAVSGVLAAMGLDARRAMGAVRLSVGRTTSEADVERAARALVQAWDRLRARTQAQGLR